METLTPHKTRLTQFVAAFHKSGLVELYRDGVVNGHCQRGFHMNYLHYTPRLVFGAISSCNPTTLHFNCGHTPMAKEFPGVALCDNGALLSLACARKWLSAASKEQVLSLYLKGPCTAVPTVINWMAMKQPFTGFAQPNKCSQSTCTANLPVVVHEPTAGGFQALFFPSAGLKSTYGCDVPVHYTGAEGNMDVPKLRNAHHIVWQLNSLLVTGGPPLKKPPGQIWFGLTEENEG